MTDNNQAVEIWEIDKLIPYADNAKIHSDEQVHQLCASIRQFGWTQPIVVEGDGTIIIGHGRRLAAIKLGLERVPVVVRRDLDKTQAAALRLADNKVTSTEYDMALLQKDLQGLLAAEDINLLDLGFTEKELDFANSDLGEFDNSFFVDDISGAVEEQKEQNARKAAEIDDTAAPVADAFGFKRVSIAQSRTLRDLMSRAEAKTAKQGAEALIEILSAAL